MQVLIKIKKFIRLRREEKIRVKELKRERRKQRELARAKKKYGNKNILNNSFTLNEEEAKILLKIVNQIGGKENNIEENQEAKKE